MTQCPSTREGQCHESNGVHTESDCLFTEKKCRNRNKCCKIVTKNAQRSSRLQKFSGVWKTLNIHVSKISLLYQGLCSLLTFSWTAKSNTLHGGARNLTTSAQNESSLKFLLKEIFLQMFWKRAIRCCSEYIMYLRNFTSCAAVVVVWSCGGPSAC